VAIAGNRNVQCLGGFIPLIGDVLPLMLFLIIAVLSALDFMLACPNLGAVIAQYNQF
jgi:hypothetical protein